MSTAAKRFLLVLPLLLVTGFGLLGPFADTAPSEQPGGAHPAAAILTPSAADAVEGPPDAVARPALAESLEIPFSPEASKRLRSAPQPPATGYTPPRTATRRMPATAYCPCPRCCGRHSDGKTASGRSIRTNGSRFVAADTSVLPFGTAVSVPGYHAGAPVPVLDRGGRIKGNRLDVFFLSHSEAQRWGKRWLTVTVYLD